MISGKAELITNKHGKSKEQEQERNNKRHSIAYFFNSIPGTIYAIARSTLLHPKHLKEITFISIKQVSVVLL